MLGDQRNGYHFGDSLFYLETCRKDKTEGDFCENDRLLRCEMCGQCRVNKNMSAKWF